MHRILPREVVIDVPSSHFDAVQRFWAQALDAQARRLERYPEFVSLDARPRCRTSACRTWATRRPGSTRSRPVE